MGEEGLQARGAYKGWPRPSRRLALAAPESSRDVAEQGAKRSLTKSFRVALILSRSSSSYFSSASRSLISTILIILIKL